MINKKTFRLCLLAEDNILPSAAAVMPDCCGEAVLLTPLSSSAFCKVTAAGPKSECRQGNLSSGWMYPQLTCPD